MQDHDDDHEQGADVQERGRCVSRTFGVSSRTLQLGGEGTPLALTWLEDEGPSELDVARVAFRFDAVARASEQRADDECSS